MLKVTVGSIPCFLRPRRSVLTSESVRTVKGIARLSQPAADVKSKSRSLILEKARRLKQTIQSSKSSDFASIAVAMARRRYLTELGGGGASGFETIFRARGLFITANWRYSFE